MATKVREQAAEAAPSKNGSSLVSDEKLKQLYSTMVKCRVLEERIRILKKQARFKGNYYAAVGQEATEVGTTIDLRDEDTIAPSHRDFIANYIKGVPLNAMLSQSY